MQNVVKFPDNYAQRLISVCIIIFVYNNFPCLENNKQLKAQIQWEGIPCHGQLYEADMPKSICHTIPR